MKKNYIIFVSLLLIGTTINVSAEETDIVDKRTVIYDKLEAKGIDTTYLKEMHSEIKDKIDEVDKEAFLTMTGEAKAAFMKQLNEDVKTTRKAYLEMHKEVMNVYRNEIKTKIETKIQESKEIMNEKLEEAKESRDAIKNSAMEIYRNNMEDKVEAAKEAAEKAKKAAADAKKAADDLIQNYGNGGNE